MTAKKFTLYVLELEDHKWYIGITTKRPEERYAQHKNGFMAAAWAKQYKPIRLIDTKFLGDLSEEDAKEYENKVTRIYMKKYGINNVRGGDLTSTENYFIRFSRLIPREAWQIITVLIFQSLIILWLLIDKYTR